MPTSRNRLPAAADAARLPTPPSFRRASRLAAAPTITFEDLPTVQQLDLGRALRQLHLTITRGETMTTQIANLATSTSWPEGSPGDIAYRRTLCHMWHLAMAGVDADREALAEVTKILDLLPPPSPPELPAAKRAG